MTNDKCPMDDSSHGRNVIFKLIILICEIFDCFIQVHTKYVKEYCPRNKQNITEYIHHLQKLTIYLANNG